MTTTSIYSLSSNSITFVMWWWQHACKISCSTHVCQLQDNTFSYKKKNTLQCLYTSHSLYCFVLVKFISVWAITSKMSACLWYIKVMYFFGGTTRFEALYIAMYSFYPLSNIVVISSFKIKAAAWKVLAAGLFWSVWSCDPIAE